MHIQTSRRCSGARKRTCSIGLKDQFQTVFDTGDRKTLSAFDSALDNACDTLIAAG